MNLRVRTPGLGARLTVATVGQAEEPRRLLRAALPSLAVAHNSSAYAAQLMLRNRCAAISESIAWRRAPPASSISSAARASNADAIIRTYQSPIRTERSCSRTREAVDQGCGSTRHMVCAGAMATALDRCVLGAAGLEDNACRMRTTERVTHSTAHGPLSPIELELIDAYWRAANYLSVGQIYLLDNPLLREPLRNEHVKPRLLGHFGTVPGLNLVYAHLNRAIRQRELNAIYITGPGHGGPGLVANAYLRAPTARSTRELLVTRKACDGSSANSAFQAAFQATWRPRRPARSTREGSWDMP